MTEIRTSSRRIRDIFKYLLLLALAGGLLYLSFRGVKWRDFAEGFRNCNYAWILASMLVGFSGFVIRALRWRLLLLPLNRTVTFKEAYDGVTIAYLTNFALPRAGEFARCGVISRNRKVSFEEALGTVVLERSFDLFCLIGWIIILLLFKWSEFGLFLKEQLAAPLVERLSRHTLLLPLLAGGCLSLLLLLFLLRRRLAKIALFRKLSGILRGLSSGLFSAFRMKNKGLFSLYTLLLWGTYWLTSLTTIYAFPSVGNLDAADALFLMIVGGLGWVVPVQGGLGAYHFIISLALSAVYAVPQTTGVVFATISHESQALIMLLCGGLSLLSIGWYSRKK